jgi:S1-C subfamily serine protease
MLKNGLKTALLVLVILLAAIQVTFLLAYFWVSSNDLMTAHPRNPTGVHGPFSRDSNTYPRALGDGAEVWLTSCGTEDLGVAVSRVRAAVVYITGHRVSAPSSTFPPWGTPASLSSASIAGDKMGSGVLFDNRGYILTNYHVIASTDDLRISVFADRDRTYPCRVVAADPQLDLAVIKIDVPYKLPTATFGDSDRIEVGDEVLAVGCPFNLEQSVTHGIVSDVKRTISIEGRAYLDLIQTDAAINSGNSGGALIDRNGEVIGINVAIYAPNRVYCGVGFAIPINRAKSLLMKTQRGEVKS